MSEVVSFDDMLLVPQKSEIITRDSVDLSLEARHLSLSSPVFSSPMDTVTGAKMARRLNDLGAAAVIHRYNTVADQVVMFRDATEGMQTHNVGAAIGVSGDFSERADLLFEAGCRIFCLDVAHGHHMMMSRALKTMKDKYADDCTLIAGNVATNDGYQDLSDWGADIVRHVVELCRRTSRRRSATCQRGLDRRGIGDFRYLDETCAGID